MILMRNWSENLLTRLTDINVVSSCLMFRMIRSWIGVVSPTSGCLALYRAAVLYDNIDDYVGSGTAGDDRRLSFYALLRGQVVGVPEAVVETELPTSFGGAFRQRTRWSKSAWLGIPFVLTNLRSAAMVLYMYPLVFTVMWPVVLAVLVRVALLYENPVFLYGLLYWEAVAVCMTTIYVLYRPGLTVRQRLAQWALAPIYPLFGLLLLRPAAYWSLTQLRSTSWHTRGAEHTGLTQKVPATGQAAA
jgi:hyaluronan synthase